MTNVITGLGSVEVGDGSMALFLARPEGEARGAVLVLQEAFGVNSYIQDVAVTVAEQGYLAVAPDLFHRVPDGPRSYADRELAMATIGAITRDDVVEDLTAALEWLSGLGIARSSVAVLGFCFGGRAAFSAAVSGLGIAGTIVFYGPGFSSPDLVSRVGSVDAPLLLINGADDPSISADDIATVTTALAAADKQFDSHVFDGAGHAFHCHARPALHNKDAAESAWNRTTTFLSDVLH